MSPIMRRKPSGGSFYGIFIRKLYHDLDTISNIQLLHDVGHAMLYLPLGAVGGLRDLLV